MRKSDVCWSCVHNWRTEKELNDWCRYTSGAMAMYSATGEGTAQDTADAMEPATGTRVTWSTVGAMYSTTACAGYTSQSNRSPCRWCSVRVRTCWRRCAPVRTPSTTMLLGSRSTKTVPASGRVFQEPRLRVTSSTLASCDSLASDQAPDERRDTVETFKAQRGCLRCQWVNSDDLAA